jgi:hypothetical protein
VPRRLDSGVARLYLAEHVVAFTGTLIRAKKPRSFALIKNRGVLLGFVEAPDQKAAELAAAKAFTLSEWQRKRLLVRERI